MGYFSDLDALLRESEELINSIKRKKKGKHFCTKCKKEKSTDDFTFDSNLMRFRSHCRKCRAKTARENRIKGREANQSRITVDINLICDYLSIDQHDVYWFRRVREKNKAMGDITLYNLQLFDGTKFVLDSVELDLFCNESRSQYDHQQEQYLL